MADAPAVNVPVPEPVVESVVEEVKPVEEKIAPATPTTKLAPVLTAPEQQLTSALAGLATLTERVPMWAVAGWQAEASSYLKTVIANVQEALNLLKA